MKLMTPTVKKPALYTVNNILSTVVVVVALYILAVPFYPIIKNFITASKKPAVPYQGKLAESLGVSAPNPLPKENKIVIPAAKIDVPIYTGKSLSVIDNGGSWIKNIWTQDPRDNGNTIIIGHRFTYKHPEGAFYNLDKVDVGDRLAVYWEGDELLYEVTERKTVGPDQVEVEAKTEDRILTIYTCTPLYTATHRLVLIAKPVVEGGSRE